MITIDNEAGGYTIQQLTDLAARSAIGAAKSAIFDQTDDMTDLENLLKSIFVDCYKSGFRLASNRKATIATYVNEQAEFSFGTFGPGARLEGICKHITKELTEIAANPGDVEEWCDVAILALDGAWRAGFTGEEVAAAMIAKLEKNMSRTWPDWRTSDPNGPIEHDRSKD